ncbi:bifunctional 3-(3-hydroxy-phenyl)propionate/3-hydroxycinnamic acid hydroxylase [Myxococcus sp. K15C18031901]|uniref:bifunctional 3-(3-hydroxy-phenyl)propionate/3-hydroxycinnamic acid hydroxylase n=1 Tax=Myxococcus dinghuensis TaxID=2906761 RepID=UPI0020A74831|nr:bifunctional 3-(3-hydroxy-phenyl)propionate/3-hydroxycinnamic acid hydroxylase [Myxococcus dinghuensis]MCP3103391.1 bifunctional 3-(3-hydroxy-phenyl)propionate/3-hydroxycinnamic acid hydroxylase [Myxococcus dinghuensis]
MVIDSSGVLHDVVVVGLGPTGAMLGNLLGREGCSVVGLEREDDIYFAPRAVHFDDEVMRVFQGVGLASEIARTSEPFTQMEFLLKPGTEPVMRTTIGSQDGRHGYAGAYWFHQPTLEGHFHAGLARYPHVKVHRGMEVTSVVDQGGHVEVRARSRSGEEHLFRARYVVGCDGARSMVRREAALPLVSADFDEAWVVVDTKTRTGQKHPDLPRHHRQICDPRQPVTYVPLAGPHYEWQFMVMGGLSEREATDPVRVREQLRGFVDLDTVELVRIAYYKFHALWAPDWRAGRILLAGDAAHQMPPFLGQGMCAGIRDAVSLAWRLRLLLRGLGDERLLDDYQAERSTHVRHIIEGAMYLGRVIQTRSRLVGFLRDWLLFRPTEALAPLKRLAYRHANRKRPLETGYLLKGSTCAGELPPQPWVLRRDGAEVLLDETLGTDFTLLARSRLLDTPEARASVSLLRERLPLEVRDFGPGAELGDRDGVLTAWFTEKDLDFVLLRPDRYVLGAGRLADLGRVVEFALSRFTPVAMREAA